MSIIRPTQRRLRSVITSHSTGDATFSGTLRYKHLTPPEWGLLQEPLKESDISSLSTLLLKTEMLAEELQHVILKTVSNLARVSSLVLFKAVLDSIPIKDLMSDD